jgi:hypothetical protein
MKSLHDIICLTALKETTKPDNYLSQSTVENELIGRLILSLLKNASPHLYVEWQDDD